MIDKIIIAEDQEIANLSVQRTMEELRIPQVDHAFYCDDALQKITVARQKGEPYDLLITDLYFESDGIAQKIAGGFDLVREVRAIQPKIRILVFSAENRPASPAPLCGKPRTLAWCVPTTLCRERRRPRVWSWRPSTRPRR